MCSGVCCYLLLTIDNICFCFCYADICCVIHVCTKWKQLCSIHSNIFTWGSSFQWFMGAIGGSSRVNRPNCRCRGGRLIVGTLWNYWKTWVGAYKGKALNRDNTVHCNMLQLKESGNCIVVFVLNVVMSFDWCVDVAY